MLLKHTFNFLLPIFTTLCINVHHNQIYVANIIGVCMSKVIGQWQMENSFPGHIFHILHLIFITVRTSVQHYKISCHIYDPGLVSKVRKRAKIRNRYNQAPHLTQDTYGKVTTSQLEIKNDSQEVSPFPAGNIEASINRHARKHNKTRQKLQMIHKRSTTLEQPAKIFYQGQMKNLFCVQNFHIIWPII